MFNLVKKAKQLVKTVILDSGCSWLQYLGHWQNDSVIVVINGTLNLLFNFLFFFFFFKVNFLLKFLIPDKNQSFTSFLDDLPYKKMMGHLQEFFEVTSEHQGLYPFN